MRRASVVLVLLAPLLLAANAPTAEDWLERGFYHAKRWETDKERECYRRAIALDPGLLEAHGALALSNYTGEDGSIDVVVAGIREYLRSSPWRDHLGKAIADWEVYGEERRFPVARREVLDKAEHGGAWVLERAAEDVGTPVHRTQLWLLAGQRRLATGHRPAARADFEKAAKGTGGRQRMDARLFLAGMDASGGRLADAVKHLRAAVAEGSLACRRIREGRGAEYAPLFASKDPAIRAALAELTDEWYGDRGIRAELGRARERAGREGKKVLLLWYGPYCPYVMLLEERLAHPRIRKLLAEKFVLVRMDQGALCRGLSVEIEYGDVMKAHGVPSFHVVNPDGTMHSVMRDGPLMDVPHRRFSVTRIAEWLEGVPTG